VSLSAPVVENIMYASSASMIFFAGIVIMVGHGSRRRRLVAALFFIAMSAFILSCGSGGDTTDPSTPASLSATAFSSSRIDLTWTASTDNRAVTGYNVYNGATFVSSTASTSYSDTGLAASTNYCYTVTAYDAAGNESAASSQKCTDTLADDTDPSVPDNLSATAFSSSQIDLTWTAATDDTAVTGYNVYRDASLISSTASTSYSDTGLAANTNYCYTVTAYDAAGNESAASFQQCITTPRVSSTIDLDPNTTYYWKVVADDGNGETATSEVWTFTTQ